MRIAILFFIFYSVLVDSFGQLERIRELYFKASDETGIRNYYSEMLSKSEVNATELAYKGVAIAMYASLDHPVGDKFNFFSEGKKMIESAVLMDWYNPEIRFLRFSVQSEVPFFLNYAGKLEEDAYVIIDAFEKKHVDVSASFWKNAIFFLKKSGELNSDQKMRLSKFS